LLGAVTAQLGFRHLTVAKRLKNPAVTEWIGRMREESGMEVAWVDQDVTMRLMERLEQKGIVSMVTDQDARSRGVKVRFLGQEASAHRGAALLALSGGSAIVVGTIVRTVDGRHHEIEYTRVQPPEPTGNLEADVVALTQSYTDILSAKILEHPADYLWAHDRFKRTRQQT
jgi:KDO2-lipid IV(A) lauroyltransferase